MIDRDHDRRAIADLAAAVRDRLARAEQQEELRLHLELEREQITAEPSPPEPRRVIVIDLS